MKKGERMGEDQAAVVKLSGAAAGVTIYGLTLNEWVAICTIIYCVLQIGLLLPKYWALLRKLWSRA